MSNDDEGALETLIQFLYCAPIGLAQMSIEGNIELLNPMSARLLMPLSPDGSLDNLFQALHDVAPALRSMVEDFEPASGVICESLRIRMPAGARSPWSHLSLSLLKLNENRLMASLSDATVDVQRERQGVARRLNDAARTDTLTGLPNRAALRLHLQSVLMRSQHGEHFAVLFINCDRFKQINDSLGHGAGDELLRLLADRLRASVRQHARGSRDDSSETDSNPLDLLEVPIARIGSDEFVVVIDDLIRPDDAHVVAQQLVDFLAKPYGIDQAQVHCPVSIGIVLQAQAVGDADAVLQDASIAMVETKRAGGSSYRVFEPAMRQRAARRADIESALRTAVADNQLFVVYQPVVGLLEDDRLDCGAGVEALVRWRHPVRGVIPPFEFISVAEECGLIGVIGDFVLETACRQFVEWQRLLGSSAPRLMAVNLSRAQLSQPGWTEKVHSVLQSTGMPARSLQLELTESLAAQDTGVQKSLHALKALGLTIALDDFGTGYSSLASLHLLPVDIVKIDRSFVTLVDSSPHHRVLIEATVRVANSLGMGTVAEGIETRSQESVIRSLGCHKGQGYLFAKPMPAEEIASWCVDPTERLPADGS